MLFHIFSLSRAQHLDLFNRKLWFGLLSGKQKVKYSKWSADSMVMLVNTGPAELGYALPLQTV